MSDVEGTSRIEINKPAPKFKAKAYYKNNINEVELEEFKGKWVVLFFYPADFTFVCPTEISEVADLYDEFKKNNTEILTISTDTAFVHKAWHDNSSAIKKVKFPMVADPTGNICRAYGTYIEDEGLSLRATFIIDPDGFVKAYEMHDNSVGRSAEEIFRKIEACDFVRKNKGEVCPASWKPGEKTLKPGVDLIGKI